jgi:AcrR family transcriptional regulator
MRAVSDLPEGASREARKAETREALLAAVLDLLAGERSFTSLSLREVTREAGVVPAAFYRHFPDMESLGLSLVEASFRTLQSLMREARRTGPSTDHLVRRSVETYVAYVRGHLKHFRFVAKERFSGTTSIRIAIRNEIRLFSSDLALDLSRFAPADRIDSDDLRMIAGLIINTMAAMTEMLIDVPEGDHEGERELVELATKQLRLILFGSSLWRSSNN